MAESSVREWLFAAIAAQERVDIFEAEGLGVRAPEDPRATQRVLAIDDFSSSIRQKAMAALPAYLAFFCIENAVRELISERMSEAHGSDWWSEKASRSLREKAESRQAKEGVNRWHIRRGDSPIFYTDFGDLKSLLQNNWSDFEDLFPDLSWVSSRLDELEQSRNIIAHSNVLDEREVSRIRIYLQDWVRQVG